MAGHNANALCSHIGTVDAHSTQGFGHLESWRGFVLSELCYVCLYEFLPICTEGAHILWVHLVLVVKYQLFVFFRNRTECICNHPRA